MSIKLMNLVWESKATRQLTPSTKNVFAMIANNASDDGHAISLKVEKIHTQTNLDHRTIQKSFRSLEEDGFITIRQRQGRVSIYIIHIDRLEQTPGTTPGVGVAASQDVSGRQQTPADTTAPQAASPSMLVDAPAQSAGQAGVDGRSDDNSTPGITPGVGCGEPCGSNIHSPGVRPPAPGTTPGLPPATGHPPPAYGHPSPLLSLSDTSSLLRADPDGKKNSQDGKTEAEGTGKRRIEMEPTAAELEQRRVAELERIDQALKRKGAA